METLIHFLILEQFRYLLMFKHNDVVMLIPYPRSSSLPHESWQRKKIILFISSEFFRAQNQFISGKEEESPQNSRKKKTLASNEGRMKGSKQTGIIKNCISMLYSLG